MFFITQLGETALVLAIRKGLTDIVSLLMKAGANVDIQDKVCLSAKYCIHYSNITYYKGISKPKYFTSHREETLH